MNFKDYANYYNECYADKPYKKEADFVYEWAGEPKTILELGGGTGGHAKYWKKSKDIYIMDKSYEMMEQADQSKVHYIRADIREDDFHLIPTCDAVFALFNVVGYADPIYYLERLPLKKGGYFIFDVWDSKRVEDDPPESTLKSINSEFVRIIEPVLGGYEPYLKLNIKIVKENKILAEENHIMRSYYKNEIESLAKSCGYVLDKVKLEKGWDVWVRLKKL